MKWLTREMVEALHAEPATDIYRLSAAYCAGIVKNHPFVDGSKRTGILSGVAFLALNDIALAFDEALIVTMVIGLAAGEVEEEELAQWLHDSASAVTA